MEETRKPAEHLTQEQLRAHYAESKKRMVRKLLALGYEMKFDKPESPAEERMERWCVNLNHVNRWFTKNERSAVKKQIGNMTYNELTKALTQFTEVYKDYLKRV